MKRIKNRDNFIILEYDIVKHDLPRYDIADV